MPTIPAEFGLVGALALGVLGLLAWLVRWMTSKLNGKLDNLADAAKESALYTRENTDAIRALRDSFERMNRAP